MRVLTMAAAVVLAAGAADAATYELKFVSHYVQQAFVPDLDNDPNQEGSSKWLKDDKYFFRFLLDLDAPENQIVTGLDDPKFLGYWSHAKSEIYGDWTAGQVLSDFHFSTDGAGKVSVVSASYLSSGYASSILQEPGFKETVGRPYPITFDGVFAPWFEDRVYFAGAWSLTNLDAAQVPLPASALLLLGALAGAAGIRRAGSRSRT